MERDNRLACYFVLFGGMGLPFGYLASSSAKSDVILLVGEPISCIGDEISHISHLFFEIWQITNKKQTDVVTETEGSHTLSVRP